MKPDNLYPAARQPQALRNDFTIEVSQRGELWVANINSFQAVVADESRDHAIARALAQYDRQMQEAAWQL